VRPLGSTLIRWQSEQFYDRSVQDDTHDLATALQKRPVPDAFSSLRLVHP